MSHPIWSPACVSHAGLPGEPRARDDRCDSSGSTAGSTSRTWLPTAPSPLRAGRRGYARSPERNAAMASMVTAVVSMVVAVASMISAMPSTVHVSMDCAGRLPDCRGRSTTTAARRIGAMDPARPACLGRPAAWTGCSMIRPKRHYRRKKRIFRLLTARRPGLVGVLPQNGLRQEHRQDRRARCHYCPSARDA